MRLPFLPPAESFRHGSKARYVAGCRCTECRKANAATWHAREARATAALSETPAAAPAPRAKTFTAPDGSKRTRVYKRGCPGVNGLPCPAGSHLRKDSKGGVCGVCRLAIGFNGNVPADKARAHLLELRKLGLGRRAVSAACDVAPNILLWIIGGRKKQIRLSTERRILAVDAGAIADGAKVPAKQARELLKKMLRAGYSRRELARRLGSQSRTPALQMGRRQVLASTALKVEKLYREVETELALERAMPRDECHDCGYSHAPEARLNLIARQADQAPAEIIDTWPCMYGDGDTGYRRLMRDLAKLRERSPASSGAAA